MHTHRLLFFLLCLPFCLSAQSTQGTTFWLAYMENLTLLANDDPIFTIVLQSETGTSGNIEVPATGLSIPFSIAAGSITEVELPDALWYSEGSDVIANKGIRIQAEDEVRAAAFHYRAYFTESTHLLPEGELGTDYLVTCYEDDTGNDPSSFVIVSTTDGTTVEITPAALTNGLQPADVPYTVTLDEGQTYQVQSNGDLTGSFIRSLSGAPVAVFSGARQADVLDCGAGADSHVYDQAVPLSNWEDLYYYVPFSGQGSDVLTILAAEAETTVFFDCAQQAVLPEGGALTVQLSAPTVISADGPIAVSLFNTSGSCSPSGNGDPNMLRLFPASYRLQEGRFISSGRFNPFINATYFDAHFVNIICPADEAGSVLLDGVLVPGGFTPFPGDPQMVWTQVPVAAGAHRLSGQGIQAYSYGFGFADAYTTHLGYSQTTTLDYVCLAASVDGVFCVDSVLNWTFETDLEVAEVDWDFGNGATAVTDTATVAFTQAGQYSVTLTLTDAQGNTFQETIPVSIENCGPAPCGEESLIILADEQACAGDPFPLAFEFSGNAVSAEWTLGNGSQANGFSPQALYSSPGSYTVTLTVKDDLNCSYQATFAVEVAQCSGCASEFVDLDFEGFPCVDSLLVYPIPEFIANQSFLTLVWTVNGELGAELEDLSFVPGEPGPYFITFEAITANGCTYFGETAVEVTECEDNPCLGLPPVSIVAESSPLCIGEPLSFSVETEADLASFQWSANNGESGEEAFFTTTFSQAGVATVFLQATDENGCLYSATLEGNLINCGDPCEDLPMVALLTEGALCVDSTLTVSAATEANLIAYTWSFGDGQGSNEAAPELSYPEAGLYTITLSASDANACLYAASLQIIVEDCLPPDPCAGLPPLEIQGDSLVCVDSLVQFTAAGPDSLVVYNWQLDNGQQSQEAMPQAAYDTDGIYTAVLIAVDTAGCTYSDNFSFEVEFCEPETGCSYAFPNTFTPNGDGVNDRFGLLSNCPAREYTLRVFNRWGEQVFTAQQPEAAWDGTFNGSSAPIETYFYVASFLAADGEQRQLQGDINLLR